MKNLILPIIFLLSFISADAFSSWNGKIFDVSQKEEITRIELMKRLSFFNVVVMGEKHYTKEVQEEEGQMISDLVSFTKKENQFSLSWEFLNASAQEETETLFKQVINHEISSADFLMKTQGTKQAAVYSPMIDVTAELGGKLFGVNLSRAEKAPVIKGGLKALDPKLLPPDFKAGGKNYFERFTKTMADHATPEQIANYFVGQSLVDDVSAYNLYKNSSFDLKFLVIGAFHSMYNDGVVVRLKERDTSSKTVNIEIIDAADYSATEMTEIFSHPIYGDRSDFFIFVNEPTE